MESISTSSFSDISISSELNSSNFNRWVAFLMELLWYPSPSSWNNGENAGNDSFGGWFDRLTVEQRFRELNSSFFFVSETKKIDFFPSSSVGSQRILFLVIAWKTNGVDSKRPTTTVQPNHYFSNQKCYSPCDILLFLALLFSKSQHTHTQCFPLSSAHK